MLNLPLAVGLGMGGMATSWLSKYKISAKDVWGKIGSWSKSGAQYGYKNSLGRGASAIARSEGLKDFAASSRIGALGLKGIRGIAGGYEEQLSKQVKSRTEFADSLGSNKRLVVDKQRELSNLRKAQAYMRASGDNDGAKALDKNIEEAVSALDLAKTSRRETYGKTTNTRSKDTLWMKVARKDKVAASKIAGDIIKKRLETEQKSLDKLQENLKKNLDRIQSQEDLRTNNINPDASKESNRQIAINKEIEKANKNIDELRPKIRDKVVVVTDLENDSSQYDFVS